MLAVTRTCAGISPDGAFSQVLPDSLGTFECQFQAGNGERDDELLASITSDKVLGTRRFPDHGGHFLQDSIAGDMTVVIIDALEMVDINHEDRHSESKRRIPLGEWSDLIDEIGSVVKSGQAISDGSFGNISR